MKQNNKITNGSAADLARAAGISRPYAWQIIRGMRTPKPAVAQKVARHFGVSLGAVYEHVLQSQQATGQVAA